MTLTYILSSVTFLLIAYVVFRVIIKRDYKKRLRLSPLSYLLEILVFAIHANMVYLILPAKWPDLPQIPGNLVIKLIAIILFVTGMTVLLAAWFKLGTGPSLGLDKNRLRTNGLYKYSRNPQLVGYSLVLASFTVLYFSYLVLSWLLLFMIVSYFMIKSEEEFLEQNYKDDYREYCKQVPRIFKI